MPERLRRSSCEPAVFRGSVRVTPVRCAVWAAQLLCVFSEALGLNRVCRSGSIRYPATGLCLNLAFGLFCFLRAVTGIVGLVSWLVAEQDFLGDRRGL
jgi:hypothetical protein